MKLRDQAYESFRDHLIAERIRPGQFLSQRELVALTGLPLGAIRELVPRLEADGLIVTVPQRGMQIANVDIKLVRNAFHLRAVLEKEAVAHFTRTAGDHEIARLSDAHARILRAASGGVPTAALLAEAQAVDWGFHDALIDALGNDLISNVYRVNSMKIRLIGQERARLTPAALQPAFDEHAAILAAIRDRAPERAAAAMESHIASARNRAMGVAEIETARIAS